jgi:hypothetical protein
MGEMQSYFQRRDAMTNLNGNGKMMIRTNNCAAGEMVMMPKLNRCATR